MANFKQILGLISMVLVLGMTSCAHQNSIEPSKGHIDGHIDGKNTAIAQAPANATQPSTTAVAKAAIPKPVTNNTYLPPPKPKAKEQLYSIVVYDTPVKEVLFAIARDSKFNIDIHPTIKGNVTLNAVDQTLPAILERLSKQVDLTYKIQNNVLSIVPDAPVLRTYQINYVNMQRITKGGISVSNEIASSNATVVSGSSGASSTVNSSSAGNNISSTVVESESKNYFWDSLIQNIRDILVESDKEVLVSRLGSDTRLQGLYDAKSQGDGYGLVRASSKDTGGKVAGSGNQELQGSIEESSEKSLKAYKTLFAASVIANKETGVLSVRATQRQHQSIQEFIDRVQAGAKRQVLIEASIVEITLNDDYQAGVDWSLLGSGALGGFSFKQELLGASLSAAPRLAIGYGKSTGIGDLATSIRLLQTYGNTKVLSSPKLMVLNSQTAILKVVNNLVYFTVESSTNQAQTTSNITFTTTPHQIPVGVWMSVTPQINENSIVTLNVRPTIARQSGYKLDPNPAIKIENRIPEIEVREMESMLQVGSGNTIVLGGLMQDEIINTDSGIPGLMKTPVVGKAFSAKNESARKTELVIFLRPTVITNASLESDELSTYKQYLPSQQLKQTLDVER